MDNKKTAIIECINEMKPLRCQEEKQLDLMLTTLNAHPLESTEEDIFRFFGASLELCEGCKHWNNSVCDILQYSCHFKIKN